MVCQFGTKYFLPRFTVVNMNTLSRRCFRLSFAILNNSSFLRPFCPALIKPERFCSRLDVQHVPHEFDDFEETCIGHELFENIDYESIVGDDLEMKKKLQVMILELSMKLQTETLLAPRKLTSNQWRTLLGYEQDFKRENYLKYLYVREKRKETFEILARNHKEAYEQEEEKKLDGPFTTSSPLDYSLQNTTLFYRINDGAIQKKYNFNLALAMMFGEDLIIDCSYEEFMNRNGIRSCSRHISYLYSCNRVAKNPFNLILCNLNKNGELMNALTQNLGGIEQDHYFITITEKHYLDLYPAKKLIYMTPHCYNDMEKYEEDSVYILGAYVDEGGYKPLSSAKAKQDGVRTVRLPLDKHLNWAQGSKLLPFNVCARILNDVKSGACWQYALRHIDVRKQKFQFFDNDVDIKKEQKLAAIYVRDEARRNMLYNLAIKGFHGKNKPECCPSDVNNNQSDYSANDNF